MKGINSHTLKLLLFDISFLNNIASLTIIDKFVRREIVPTVSLGFFYIRYLKLIALIHEYITRRIMKVLVWERFLIRLGRQHYIERNII